MPFNSYNFIFLYLPVVLIGYFLTLRFAGAKVSRLWLLAASILSYGWFKISLIPLLFISIVVNYALFRGQVKARHEATGGQKKRGRKKTSKERWLFTTALFFNIGFLAYFKYMNFFIDSFNSLSGSSIAFMKIILPLGISFFTLQQITFQFHVNDETIEECDFFDYSLFVSFFAYLTAGPITHFREIMPQFKDEKRQHFSADSFYRGVWIFVIGLFKKAVIADTFAVWANNGFAHSQELSFLPAWVAVLCYTLQLYFDFSGYSDMAVGIGRMLNIELPINFNSPFKQTNLIGFWSHWHLTLTRFITTYLYYPISKALPGKNFATAMCATFLSMFIAGIWHGAGWTFIIFGSIHGLGLVINNVYRNLKFKMPDALSWILTMALVANANVFFRAKNVTEAWAILKAMYLGNGISFDPYQFSNVAGIFAIDTVMMLGALVAGTLGVLLLKNSNQMEKDFKPNWAMAIVIPILFWISLAHFSATTEFLYFNF